MHPDAKALIWDALNAASHIDEFIHDLDFDAYAADAKTRSAVERQFEIIGEALNQLSKIAPEVAEKVPDLPNIVGFRNVLIHGYASIDDSEVWRVAQESLQPLVNVLQAL
ncbi:MAG: DUF86 domain-containing protein [Gammaproteobacteria bacterium]|nr:DUF86 domain-containing protein [Gammaproteobacteria bacterium]